MVHVLLLHPHRFPARRFVSESATGKLCCRFQIRRTGVPSRASASIDEVGRFCCVTTSSEPASRATT